MKLTLKGFQVFYHEAVVVVGAAVVGVNQLTDLLSFIPASKPIVTTVAAVLTAVLTILKTDEPIIDGLGSSGS